jgi:hypothetical protein
VTACAQANAGAVALLLQHGADAGAAGPDGQFPLGAALQSRCAECVQLLLRAGVDPMALVAQQISAALPLHIASLVFDTDDTDDHDLDKEIDEPHADDVDEVDVEDTDEAAHSAAAMATPTAQEPEGENDRARRRPATAADEL